MFQNIEYGEIYVNQSFTPVAFLALLQATQKPTNEVGSGCRKELLLTARLAIDCYDDTYIGSGTMKNEEWAYGWQQTACTPCFNVRRHNDDMGPLYRTKQGSIRCRA